MRTATPTFPAIHTVFHTAHTSSGSTEEEPRFMILRHEGFKAPYSVGFVFKRKTGRWGAAVMPKIGAIAHDIQRFSVGDMESAIEGVLCSYDAQVAS